MLLSALQQGILPIKCIKVLLKTCQIPPSIFTVDCTATDGILGLRSVCVCVCEWGGDTVCVDMAVGRAVDWCVDILLTPPWEGLG